MWHAERISQSAHLERLQREDLDAGAAASQYIINGYPIRVDFHFREGQTQVTLAARISYLRNSTTNKCIISCAIAPAKNCSAEYLSSQGATTFLNIVYVSSGNYVKPFDSVVHVHLGLR